MEKKEQQFGLMTAITMIVGICIGSGIFFKGDDILRFTGGSVALGVLVLCIGAFSIIFGSISLTELSVRTEKSGGVVGYFEEFISTEMASAFGWFQMLLYYPTINVVVAWAAGIYTLMVLGIEGSLELQILIGLGYLLFFYFLNYVSNRLGGYFQIISTYVKLVPLIGIALIGLFWTKDTPEIPATMTKVPLTNVGMGWLAALAPVAFSYDGWSVATSITNEVKNPKKTMPLALTIGPLIVLVVYLSYFIGLTGILGPEFVLAAGDQAIYSIGQLLFGAHGGTIITLFVVISVLGVTNGLAMGNLRMPHALASKKMMPNADKILGTNKLKTMTPRSFRLSLGCALFWMFIHYLTQKMGIMAGGDISEIAIVFSYICYPILYVKIIKMKLSGEIKSTFKGLIAPVLGILGSAIIVVGGIVSNPVYVSIFIVICFLVCAYGYYYYATTKKRSLS